MSLREALGSTHILCPVRRTTRYELHMETKNSFFSARMFCGVYNQKSHREQDRALKGWQEGRPGLECQGQQEGEEGAECSESPEGRWLWPSRGTTSITLGETVVWESRSPLPGHLGPMWQVSPGPARDSIIMKSSRVCPLGREPRLT